MKDLSKEITSTLKSNTLTSVRSNTLPKLPIVVAVDGTENDKITEWQANARKWRILNLKKFHYDDTWYTYRFSADYPEQNFAILEVENLPFKPMTKLKNKKSFICRMDQLMFNSIAEPFMLFIDRKFINWNMIDVVFDCDDAYLLIHGINYHDIVYSEFHIVILPFRCQYVGEEPDSIWNVNYDMLTDFMQDSLHVNENDLIEIEVPTMYSIYKKNGMVYNVGAWLYTQLYMDKIGMLSDDRKAKLKRMILTKYTYDQSGNIIDEYHTRFNAMDKDSYDRFTYEELCHYTLDYMKENALFKFNDDGLLDMQNGNNIIAKLDDSMRVNFQSSSATNIIVDNSKYEEMLYRESHLVFKDGLLFPECKFTNYYRNMATISNPDGNKHEIFTFNPSMIECTVEHYDVFPNYDYFTKKAQDYVKNGANNTTTKKYLDLACEGLDYEYTDTTSYDENYKNAFNVIMDYNPLFFNDEIHTTIKSTTVSGKTANESLTFPLGYEKRKGLKIPRYKYKNHETYVIVFLNGEIIDNYSEMYVAANYFYLPIDKNFANGDKIEFLFFTYCDNNEIHFDIVDTILKKLEDANKDPEVISSSLFEEYIRKKDIKIFAKYPEEIMIYPQLIPERRDIAFNVSYRDSNNILYIFKESVYNRKNHFTAVSSRKFIYERLYVDQRAYRIELGERFRYCDNQKQYAFFINGRRMEENSFLVTIPKYSRPFWGMYIYTTKFVGPNDRIELFYLPEELLNINTEENPMTIGTNGYIQANKQKLEVPYDPNFFMFFLNGKKIPHSELLPIDSYTLRATWDPMSLKRFNVYPTYRNTFKPILDYMKGSKLSKYDTLIKFIKDESSLGTKELDTLFMTSTVLTDTEPDKIKWNVNTIAILNEIVRDFWVTSGYNYNDRPFVYDYQLDEYIVKDEVTGNYFSPALDATPLLNIIKNDIYLLYMTCNYDPRVFEIGSSVFNIEFEWEFTKPIENASIVTVNQFMNDERLDNDARRYFDAGPVSQNTTYHFKFNTMSGTIEKVYDFIFCNGLYWGSVDEDLLQHYSKRMSYDISRIRAIIPKDKLMPSTAELETIEETLEVLRKDYDVVDHMKAMYKEFLKIGPEYTQDIMAILDDGRILYNLMYIGEDKIIGDELTDEELRELLQPFNSNEDEYHSSNEDLSKIMATLNRIYSDNPTLDFDTYRIGSNNYFVFACPSRIAHNEDGSANIHFILPDVNDPELLEYGHDDKTIPVYTDGYWDDQNLLNKLDECKMEYMGEFIYTNPSGYTEPYCMWKTNGFFTRAYDDYEFKLQVISDADFVKSKTDLGIIVDETKNKTGKISANNTELKQIRLVNTAAPLGSDVNDKVVMLNAVLIKHE